MNITALIITFATLGLIAMLIIIGVVYQRSRLNAAIREKQTQLAHWRYPPNEWQNLVAVFNQKSLTLRPLSAASTPEVIISQPGILIGGKFYEFTVHPAPEVTFETGDLPLLRFKLFKINHRSGGAVLAVELVFPVLRGQEHTVKDILGYFNQRKS
jgi:hypothetical protein